MATFTTYSDSKSYIKALFAAYRQTAAEKKSGNSGRTPDVDNNKPGRKGVLFSAANFCHGDCRVWAALRSVLVLSFGLIGLPVMAADLVTIRIETQALDLDTGTVLDSAPDEVFASASGDVKLTYDADRTPHAVVFAVGAGVAMAFVADSGFDGVTSADVADLTFSNEPANLPFSADHCVVIRTDRGAIYKIGNAYEHGLSVTLNYAAL